MLSLNNSYNYNVRRKRIYLRVSDDEYNQIKLKANAVGLGLSEYLRRCGISQKLPPRKLEPEVLEFRQQLRVLAGTASKMLTFAFYGDRNNWIQTAQELAGEIKRIAEGSLRR